MLMKFLEWCVECVTSNRRLDFETDLDHDADPGIFNGNFTTEEWANCGNIVRDQLPCGGLFLVTIKRHRKVSQLDSIKTTITIIIITVIVVINVLKNLNVKLNIR